MKVTGPQSTSGDVLDDRLFVNLDSLLESRHECQRMSLFRGPMQASRQLGRQYSRLRGRGVDFDQVRAYQPGDDIRSIDWRVTARSGKVHTKVFNEERERPVFIVCEQSNRLFFGSQLCFKSVLAAQACSLIAWTALAHNDRVGGLVFGKVCHEVRPQRNRQSLLRLFRLLIEANHALQPSQDVPGDAPKELLNQALRHTREVVRPGSILYVICDHSAVDQLNQTLLVPLAAHNDLVLLPLYDALDAELPQADMLEFVQNGEQLSVNVSDEVVRTAYAAQFLAQQHAWQHLARRLGCSLFSLNTSSSAAEQIGTMFSAQKRRGRT
mgnify:FL=1|tara:strand:+ start:4469 stop:5443 length:975 start_codon:yes stop_codon:yes gene_type:complete